MIVFFQDGDDGRGYGYGIMCKIPGGSKVENEPRPLTSRILLHTAESTLSVVHTQQAHFGSPRPATVWWRHLPVTRVLVWDMPVLLPEGPNFCFRWPKI